MKPELVVTLHSAPLEVRCETLAGALYHVSQSAARNHPDAKDMPPLGADFFEDAAEINRVSHLGAAAWVIVNQEFLRSNVDVIDEMSLAMDMTNGARILAAVFGYNFPSNFEALSSLHKSCALACAKYIKAIMGGDEFRTTIHSHPKKETA